MNIGPAPRILVISLPGMGDTINTTPLFALLKKHRPRAEISVMVMYKGTAELLEKDPNINEVIFWPFMQETAFNSLKFMWKIRKKRFDVSMLSYPSNRREYNLISFLSGAPVRIAHRYNHLFYDSLGFMNTDLVDEDDTIHNVEENVKLFSVLGGQAAVWDKPRVFTGEDDSAWSEAWIRENRLKGEPLFGISPGNALLKNHIRRRWDKDKFIQVGRFLVKQYSAKILLFGGPKEKELKEYIVRGIGDAAFNVAPATMPQTAALTKECKILITNDSGLMHTASAVDVPTAAIFGPTNIHGLYPYRMKHRIISLDLDCSPCFVNSKRPLSCHKYGDYRCITGITVEMVLQGVRELMNPNK